MSELFDIYDEALNHIGVKPRAAGHLAAGESLRDGPREIAEELGLNVDFEDLIPLGRRVGINKIGDFIDRQICHVFLYQCNQPLEAYDYQRAEVAGLIKLPIDDAMRLFAGEFCSVVVPAIGLGSPEIALTLDDFIPSIDNYVMKILILAQRFFAGEKELWI